jgi:uncharacterized membrane protein YeaQ/YmgE (transglycosylase-associated protein family)
MDVILWIIFGLVVGVVAKFVMPGRDPGGLIVTIVLGIVGGLLGAGSAVLSVCINPGSRLASSWRSSAPSWSLPFIAWRSVAGGPRHGARRRSSSPGSITR